MSTITRTQATEGQKKQNSRFLEDAFQKLRMEVETMFANLDSDNAQRFLGNGGEFITDIQSTTLSSFQRLSISDQFADEEVESNYGYLSGYKPKDITPQCNDLRQLFPGLGFPNMDLVGAIERGEVKLPEHAEGFFAIPNWTKNPAIFGTSYAQAVQKILDTIKATRGKLYNYRDGQINDERLRQSARTLHALDLLIEAQGNPDILIVPGQFGLRHRGRSVRRAREVFFSNEFGFGAFAVGIMLLTHPERLMNYDDLWIDCSGDEFDDPDSDVRFDRCPFFDFRDGMVKFGTDWFADASGYYGSASGLVPQS